MEREGCGAPMIALDGVGKRFRSGVEALAGIDLAVAPGSFVSLLGPSGCGTSTLLRIIAGLVPASSGRVVAESDLAQRLGFVFQEPTLMPWATVYLPLRLAGERREDVAERIAETLAALGLGG